MSTDCVPGTDAAVRFLIKKRMQELIQELVGYGLAADARDVRRMLRLALDEPDPVPEADHTAGPEPLQETGGLVEDSFPRGNEEERVARICRYIREHFSEKITISSLGEAFFLSPSHISHIFKKHVGIPPGKYLEEFRLFQADFLLRNTDMPVSEIALRVGYRDSNYFSKCFHKKYGFPPSGVRKETE